MPQMNRSRSPRLPRRTRADSRARRDFLASPVERMEDRVLLTSPPPNLIGGWTGDGTPADSAGGNDGVLVNGTTYGPGRTGQAFAFDGVNDFVQAPDSDLWAFGTHDFTIASWVNFNAVRSSTVSQPTVVFVGNDEGGGSQNKWTFALGGDQLYFHINSPTLGPVFYTVPFIPTPGQWYHLSVNRSGSTLGFFVNGVLIGTQTTTLAVPNANAPLTIGSSEGLPSMDGRIDEVQIYDRALTPVEIADLAGSTVVTNINDSGPGSLRAAILNVNALPADAPTPTITFAIPGSGVQTVRPLSQLPTVTRPVVIDGYSQPGSSPNTLAQGDNAVLLIQIDGTLPDPTNSLTPGYGLLILAGQSTVQGLAVGGFAQAGISINGAGGVVQGCFIGTDANGTVSVPNGYNGVELAGAGTRLGTDGDGVNDYAERNIVSGNKLRGVQAGPGTVVAGNFIGTDRTGKAALPNGNVQTGSGLGVEAGVGSRIGVDGNHTGAAAERNIISGNVDTGVAAYNGSVVAGNYIGLDVTGNLPIGVTTTGVVGAGGAIIGTNGDGKGDVLERNVISANSVWGVYLAGEANHVAGNFIGTNADGNAPVGRQQIGIFAPGNHNHIGLDPADESDNRGAKLNVISGNGIQNVYLAGDWNTVAGNYIGLDATGARNVSSNADGYGVHIHSGQGNLVGTDSDGKNDVLERNVISGFFVGLEIAGGTGHVVAGNYIGTDATGAAMSGAGPDGQGGNRLLGVTLQGDVSGVRVGVDPASANPVAGRNVIAGQSNGIGTRLYTIGVKNNVVAGNYIGTDRTGTFAIPNFLGVQVIGAALNTIGGTTPVEGNLISGNRAVGVYIESINTPGQDHVLKNRVIGNRIGTDSNGTGRLGNGTGVGVNTAASGNQIGGAGPGEGNLIAYNGTGVTVLQSAPPPVGNVIRGNSIFGNDALGIDLGADGVTPNGLHDPGEPGPNNWQAYPVVQFVTGGSTTTVGLALDSRPNSTYTIDLYANASADGSGHGEGQRWLGAVTVDTDATGHASKTATLPGATALNEWVSATATGADGTSEFSLDDQVDVVPFVTHVTLAASTTTPLAGVDTVTFTATVTSDTPGAGVPTGVVRFLDGATVIGQASLVGGVATLDTSTLAAGSHSITAAYLGGGNYMPSTSPAVTVSPVAPASITGVVFADFNNDGEVDFGEGGISGAAVALDGTDDLGRVVHVSRTTDGDGFYGFLNLRPGHYKVTETQPAGFTQGVNSVGSAGGTVVGDQFDLYLTAGLDALNYNYGERPAGTGQVHAGQTAGIGFWNNKNGQALIKALNGGVGTQLGDWLATTFPHMFGASAGTNNLSAKTNTQVAGFFQTRFVLKGEKLDAQVLATALAVYVTNAALNPTAVGSQYGFIVSGFGVGAATCNVGSNGGAFGVADGTVMTVMDLLLAVDAQAVNGVLYNNDPARRTKANNVFGAINQSGGI
ncbi:MAG: LamG-like jellyroll fold domain-containing protein [Isosphaeraceae bacterium]